MTDRHQARAREAGFTLVELLVAMTAGSVVMLAIFGMLDFSAKSSDTAQARSIATQRTNALLDRIERVTNAVVCRPDGQPAVEEGTTVSLTMYVDTTGGLPRAAAVDAQRRPAAPRKVRFRYDAANRRMLYDEAQGTYTGTTTAVTFPAFGTSPEVLATDVGPLTVDGVAQPVLSYLAYPQDAGGNAVITTDGASATLAATATTGLSTADRARVASIALRLAVRPDSVPADRRPEDVPVVRTFTNGAIDTGDTKALPGCV